MALRKRINRIDKNAIRAGQVLEIEYTDNKRRMIFVIDPKTAGGANSQSRANMLFAYKLRDLSEKDAYDLIMKLRTKDESGKQPYDILKNSKYLGESRSLRTYDLNKITAAWRVTLGHPLDVSTKKIYIGNSVLYGCAHGSYVFVHEKDWPTLENEVRTKRATFFEGTEGHENSTLELLNYLVEENAYTSDTWENPNVEEAPVLNLYGGDTETIIAKIAYIAEEREISYSGRVVDIWAKTSGYSPSNKSSWGKNKLTAEQIVDITKLASPSLVISPLETIVTSAKEFFDIFKPFHETAQKYAFGKDWRKDKPEQNFFGEDVPRTALETLTRNANLRRDVYLVKLMMEKPGVYFAGEGHVDLVRLVYRAQRSGVDLSGLGE
jgi:hypothetical protein